MKRIIITSIGVCVVALAAFGLIANYAITENNIQSPSAPMIDEVVLDSLEDTMNYLKVDATVPTSLPPNVSFDHSIVSKDKESARIMFSGDGVELEYYVQTTSFNPVDVVKNPDDVPPITVTVEEKGTITESYQIKQTGDPNHSKILNVDGQELVYVFGNKDQIPSITWHIDGVTHQIISDLSQVVLIDIYKSTIQ